MISDGSPNAHIAENCAEIRRRVDNSRAELDKALRCAWKVGRQLAVQREVVLRRFGRGAWPEWLRLNFPQPADIARRYLKLARDFATSEQLETPSVRQVYFRLGVSTEPKLRARIQACGELAGHIRSSQRLLLAVHRSRRRWSADEAGRQKLCRDLEPLYRELNALFSHPATSRILNPEQPPCHDQPPTAE